MSCGPGRPGRPPTELSTEGTGPGPSEPHPRPAGRRPGRPIIVALVVLLVAELAVRAVSSHLAVPQAWPAPELQKKFDQIRARAKARAPNDVVLVGDSMLDAAGDPEGLGAAGFGGVYNASIAGETLPTIADWTTRVVVQRLHPRTVVIGFSSNELNPATLAPATGVAAYRASRAVRAAEGIAGPIDRADTILWRTSALYRYRNSLRHPFGLTDPGAAGVFDPALTASGHDLAFTNLGYLQQGGPAHATAVVAGVIAALRGFSIGPRNVAILGDTITTLRRRGITVVLLAMPVTADLVSFHPHGAADYERAMAAFADIASRHDATFLNPGTWPTAEFADPVHLNGTGTARLSSYLAGALHP